MCGLIFLKLMMTVTNPKLVVNHRAKENDPKETTLEKYSHGVRQLLTSIQEKKNKIDTIRKDGVKFDDQSFLTLLFDRLVLKNANLFVLKSIAIRVLG